MASVKVSFWTYYYGNVTNILRSLCKFFIKNFIFKPNVSWRWVSHFNDLCRRHKLPISCFTLNVTSLITRSKLKCFLRLLQYYNNNVTYICMHAHILIWQIIFKRRINLYKFVDITCNQKTYKKFTLYKKHVVIHAAIINRKLNFFS